VEFVPFRYGFKNQTASETQKGRRDMIRITKQTDYGIVLLTHLAAHADRQYAAPELAAEARLPLPMVSKILKLLARDGLLASHRGVKGGYSLARAAEEISMAEIITALEGPIAITECISVESDCSHEALCPVRGNWQRINLAVRTALEGITLADMAVPKMQKLVTLGRGAFAGAQLQQA
jgi:FeS assembly SUF system regulator